jgi:hypothetical protein
MKTLFRLLLAGSFVLPIAYAQDLIILDEGYNTQQTLNIPTAQRGSQGCVSIETSRSSGTANALESGSLCNPRTSNFEFGPNASEITNKITYQFFDSSGAVIYSEAVTVRRVIDNLERGEHGNWVSNAAYDFDRTLQHRLWQVFGIERDGNRFKYRTKAQPGNAGTPGETIQAALDQIGINATNPAFPSSVQRNLGAVVMSLGAGAGGLSDLKCGAGDGQDSVDELRDRGIAVVVALQNTDVPSDRQTWPACLQDVILVAGQQANSFQGVRQVGVGANRGIDFFAKDTTNDSQQGNSFAAPRVAAAYAKLHQLFPRSSVGQKTEALITANTRMDTYRTRLVNGQSRTYTARNLRSSDMARAISNLTLLQPPVPDATTELNIADNTENGTFYDPNDTDPYELVVDFGLVPQATSTSLTVGTVSNISTGALSSRRDIELKFTDIFRGGGPSNNFFRLMLNGRMLQFTDTSLQNTPREHTIIINRNLLNEGTAVPLTFTTTRIGLGCSFDGERHRLELRP